MMATDPLTLARGTDFALVPSQGVEIPNFHELMASLRKETPLAAVLFAGQPSWLVTRYPDVLYIFRDEAHFSSRLLHEANSFPVMGRNVMGLEGDEHRAHRELAKPPLRYRYVMDHYVQPVLRPLCNRLVDRFAARGEADLVAEFTRGFPLAVISKLLGLPIDDEEEFSAWAMALISYAFVPDEALAAGAKFDDYLRPILDARRRRPGDDLLSMLTQSEVAGRRLEDEEVLSFVKVFFAAGTDTTYNAVGSLIHALLTTPGSIQRVTDDPDMRSKAVEELLRWNGPVGVLPRICRQDVELFGERILAGQTILMGLASANRDPGVFAQPDVFDMDRDTKKHVAFGFGEHFCLGNHLARAEMRVALDVVIDRLPGLRLLEEPGFYGSVLRGPNRLLVEFSVPETDHVA